MNESKPCPLNLRGVALGVGVGLALGVSNGPAVGLPTGIALALALGRLWRMRQSGC